jgi:hypothetical protein
MRIPSMAICGMILAMLGACAGYHQEVAALRMPRPTAHSAQLAAYTPPRPNYPSVGGDILRGTAPKSSAAYDASQDPSQPPPTVR